MALLLVKEMRFLSIRKSFIRRALTISPYQDGSNCKYFPFGIRFRVLYVIFNIKPPWTMSTYPRGRTDEKCNKKQYGPQMIRFQNGTKK